MKKILYLFLLAPVLLVAQNTSLEIHNSVENEEGVNSFTFSKMMLDAIDMTTEDEDGSIQHITGDLHKVKFLLWEIEIRRTMRHLKCTKHECLQSF